MMQVSETLKAHPKDLIGQQITNYSFCGYETALSFADERTSPSKTWLVIGSYGLSRWALYVNGKDLQTPESPAVTEALLRKIVLGRKILTMYCLAAEEEFNIEFDKDVVLTAWGGGDKYVAEFSIAKGKTILLFEGPCWRYCHEGWGQRDEFVAPVTNFKA